jgi:hypothetical protein
MLVGTAVNVSLSVLGGYAIGPAAVAGATVVGNLVTMVLVWRRASRLLGWTAADVGDVLSPVPVALLGATAAALSLAPLAARSALSSLAAVAAASAVGVAAGAIAASRQGGSPLRLPPTPLRAVTRRGSP